MTPDAPPATLPELLRELRQVTADESYDHRWRERMRIGIDAYLAAPPATLPELPPLPLQDIPYSAPCYNGEEMSFYAHAYAKAAIAARDEQVKRLQAVIDGLIRNIDELEHGKWKQRAEAAEQQATQAGLRIRELEEEAASLRKTIIDAAEEIMSWSGRATPKGFTDYIAALRAAERKLRESGL